MFDEVVNRHEEEQGQQRVSCYTTVSEIFKAVCLGGHSLSIVSWLATLRWSSMLNDAL